jgi:para-aminobenzoate synthetase component 1
LTVTVPQTAFSQADTRHAGDDVFVVRDIPWRDPLVAFAPFSDAPVAALLHSDGGERLGRWSYLAASPFTVIDVAPDLSATVDGQAVPGDPFHILDNMLARYRSHPKSAPAPFHGGAVGFFGYELVRLVECLPTPKCGATRTAMSVGLYDVVAAFDHHTRRAWVMATGFPEQEPALRGIRAHKRAQWLCDKIAGAHAMAPAETSANWQAEQSRGAVERSIEDTIEYIRAGDIFQANITQRFTADLPPGTSPWRVYLRLRELLPSPFGAYVSAGPDIKLLSASPERFLRLDADGTVETRPIKGTRPRGESPEVDAALADALTRSAKDQAENLMIVDLMRNDLSRVCENGSVRVPQFCGLESFASVHHLVSVVTGQIRADKTAAHVLRACFPGGSVTGAPKIRAMEVIHELEPAARGPYCGAVAWIGFDGTMDSSIIIRSLVIDSGQVVAQAGGGIVADSVPALEYEEALTKLRPLLAVFDRNLAR